MNCESKKGAEGQRHRGTKGEGKSKKAKPERKIKKLQRHKGAEGQRDKGTKGQRGRGAKDKRQRTADRNDSFEFLVLSFELITIDDLRFSICGLREFGKTDGQILYFSLMATADKKANKAIGNLADNSSILIYGCICGIGLEIFLITPICFSNSDKSSKLLFRYCNRGELQSMFAP